MAIAMSRCRNLCNVTIRQLVSLLLFVPMHVSETYYLVQWLDEDEDGDVLYDVLPSKTQKALKEMYSNWMLQCSVPGKAL